MPRTPLKRTLAIVLAAAVVGGLAGAASVATFDSESTVDSAAAAPTSTRAAAPLRATHYLEHASLGVEVETIDPSVAKLVRGLPEHGVSVARVTRNSPAARAGLIGSSRLVSVDGVGVPLGGDAIVAIDGKAIRSADALATLVAAHQPGDHLRLRVVRAGSTRTVDVTLGRLS
jgi:S1-C subfamily serine protease